MKSGAAMDSNLQLRRVLSSDVQRHIHESIEDWRITLDNFTSSLEDVKLEVKSNSMSHDDALNEIGELLLTFHDPDENFKKYEKHATFLLDIHAPDVGAALVNDFTNLVKDWNSLNANIESFNTSGGNSADKERITKADIGTEEMSDEILENEKSSDHQISIDEGFEDDTSATSIETFDVDVITSISIDDTSKIDKEVNVSEHIQVDAPNDNTALELLATAPYDFSYVDKEVDMSTDTEIETSCIDQHFDLTAVTEVDAAHIDTEVDLTVDTEGDAAHIESEVDLSAKTEDDVAHIHTEIDLTAETEDDAAHTDTEVDLTVDTEVNVSHIETEIDLSVDTEIDLSHSDTEVDLLTDTEIDVAHIGTEGEKTVGNISNEVDTSTVADGVDHVDQSIDLDHEIDATAEQVDHVPCSIEASLVGVEEETPTLITEVNKEISLKNPIDTDLQVQALESKVEVDSENTAESSQKSKDVELPGVEEEEKEEGEKDAMVPIEVNDIEADPLNSLKHRETIVDYTDDEAKVPARRNSNFFLRLCCCGFYRANTKTYY